MLLKTGRNRPYAVLKKHIKNWKVKKRGLTKRFTVRRKLFFVLKKEVADFETRNNAQVERESADDNFYLFVRLVFSFQSYFLHD